MYNLIDPETQSYVHLEATLTALGKFAHTREMFALVCCTSILSVSIRKAMGRSNRIRVYLPVRPISQTPSMTNQSMMSSRAGQHSSKLRRAVVVMDSVLWR